MTWANTPLINLGYVILFPSWQPNFFLMMKPCQTFLMTTVHNGLRYSYRSYISVWRGTHKPCGFHGYILSQHIEDKTRIEYQTTELFVFWILNVTWSGLRMPPNSITGDSPIFSGGEVVALNYKILAVSLAHR